MSYSASNGPRLVFGILGGAVIGMFLLVVLKVLGPRLYEAYQWRKIDACEKEHGIGPSDKMPVFGFDIGGWSVTGDKPH